MKYIHQKWYPSITRFVIFFVALSTSIYANNITKLSESYNNFTRTRDSNATDCSDNSSETINSSQYDFNCFSRNDSFNSSAIIESDGLPDKKVDKNNSLEADFLNGKYLLIEPHLH